MTGQALKAMIESMFEVIRSRSTAEEIVTICCVPGCGDMTGNRSTNLKTGKTSCWKCSVGGDFVKTMRWLGYAVEDDTVPMLTLEEFYRLLDPPRPKSIIPVINSIQFPEGFHSCYDNPDSAYTKQIAAMAVRKNLRPEDLFNAGVGYVTGDMNWHWFAVFPVLEYGRLVYIQGRTYWDDPGATTKKFPNRSEAPLSSKYWIYNIDEVDRPGVDTVVIVESILNVLSLKVKFEALGITNMVPVCVFKHQVSKTQFLKLIRFKNVKEAILLFDFDAIDLSWRDAKYIDDLIRVSIAEMPFSATNKKLDPNDDVDAAWVAIQNRKQYSMVSVAEQLMNLASKNYYVPFIGYTLIDSKHPAKMSTSENCSCNHVTETIQRKDSGSAGEGRDRGQHHPAGESNPKIRDGGSFGYR